MAPPIIYNNAVPGEIFLAEQEEFAWWENLVDVAVAVDNKILQSFRRRHSGTLNESTNVGVKTGGSRVGVLKCASKADGNRRQGTRCFI